MEFVHNINAKVPDEWVNYSHLRGAIPREFQQIYSPWEAKLALMFLNNWYRHKHHTPTESAAGSTPDLEYTYASDGSGGGGNVYVSKLFDDGKYYKTLQYLDNSHPIYVKGFIDPLHNRWEIEQFNPYGGYLSSSKGGSGGGDERCMSGNDYTLYMQRKKKADSIHANFNYHQWCVATRSNFSLNGKVLSNVDDADVEEEEEEMDL